MSSIRHCLLYQNCYKKKLTMKVRGESQEYPRRKTPSMIPTVLRNRKKTILNRIPPNSLSPHNQIQSSGLLEMDCFPSKLPQISSTSWCLYDASTDKIIGFRENHQREVASLTKIMTTMLVLNLLERYSMDKCKRSMTFLEVLIKVSKSATQLNGTSAQLKHSTWLKVEDLVYGAILPSGNDAAYLLAQVFGLLLYYEKVKSEEKQYEDIESIDICMYNNTQPFVNKFLKEMNRIAKELRMYKTSFANPHGLANVLNYSTAADMMTLSKYASANRQFRKIMNTEQYNCECLNENLQDVEQIKEWKNTNKLLCKGWEGIKTGQTVPAGSCLASLREDIYIIVLNCQNVEARFDETDIIWNWYKNLTNK